MSRLRLTLHHVFWLWTAALVTVSPVFAGGGPENVLLVVNSGSADSISLANHYIALRKIPSSNVLYVNLELVDGTITVADFRKQILLPITQTLQVRGIGAQIDTIAYSCGIPWVVDFSEDVPGSASARIRCYGSLTGLTFLWTSVALRKADQYQHPNSNRYMRKILGGKQLQPTHGFRSWYGWSEEGDIRESGGERFMLCTALGAVATANAPGNTLAEAVAVLERSAAADGTMPDGTVYFTKHADIRSTTRTPYFESAAAELKALGHKAEIIPDLFPKGRRDIAGAVLGFPNTVLKPEEMQIQPGAIVENLTSYGGKFDKSHGQTLLSEFLKLGAAGASGTVDEPGAIAQKFPHPFVQVHYARGCALAESFYQAVQSPYQLLVVGDPLCSPWAKIPQVTATGVTANQVLSGMAAIEPAASVADGKVDRFELFLDGARISRCGPGEKLEFDSALYSDGVHDLRIVGIDGGPIETQGRLNFSVRISNHNREVTAKLTAARVKKGNNITITAIAAGSKSLIVYSNGRVLAQAPGGSAVFTIPTAVKSPLGTGPVTMRVLGLGATGVASHALSAPLTVTIDP